MIAGGVEQARPALPRQDAAFTKRLQRGPYTAPGGVRSWLAGRRQDPRQSFNLLSQPHPHLIQMSQ